MAKLAHAQSGKAQTFADRYTKDTDGFYVRNEKPSASTINDKRIVENVRALVNDAAQADEND